MHRHRPRLGRSSRLRESVSWCGVDLQFGGENGASGRGVGIFKVLSTCFADFGEGFHDCIPTVFRRPLDSMRRAFPKLMSNGFVAKLNEVRRAKFAEEKRCGDFC